MLVSSPSRYLAAFHSAILRAIVQPRVAQRYFSSLALQNGAHTHARTRVPAYDRYRFIVLFLVTFPFQRDSHAFSWPGRINASVASLGPRPPIRTLRFHGQVESSFPRFLPAVGIVATIIKDGRFGERLLGNARDRTDRCRFPFSARSTSLINAKEHSSALLRVVLQPRSKSKPAPNEPFSREGTPLGWKVSGLVDSRSSRLVSNDHKPRG